MTTRIEHLAWCKERALEYAARDDLTNAWASMVSDLGKHPETEGHPAIGLGMMMLIGGMLSSKIQMVDFIEGFN